MEYGFFVQRGIISRFVVVAVSRVIEKPMLSRSMRFIQGEYKEQEMTPCPKFITSL